MTVNRLIAAFPVKDGLISAYTCTRVALSRPRPTLNNLPRQEKESEVNSGVCSLFTWFSSEFVSVGLLFWVRSHETCPISHMHIRCSMHSFGLSSQCRSFLS